MLLSLMMMNPFFQPNTDSLAMVLGLLWAFGDMFNIPRTALVLVLLHVLLPKLAEKSVVIHVTFFFSWNKSCATAAIGDFRLTQHTHEFSPLIKI